MQRGTLMILLIGLWRSGAATLCAQVPPDSIRSMNLEEVVVTGQYAPQSVKNSVYQVRAISAQHIEAQGANTMEEVLANELNIRFVRDNATGTSNMTLQGISGKNVKVLLDGVPLTGRSGTQNEVDLSQINPQTIERIEIVEGPMAVSYGADALAGVINIITKAYGEDEWRMSASLQEETVGSQFAFFGQGIHSLNLSGGYSFSPRWQVQADARLYRFGGWGGSGRDHLWYPKVQYTPSGMIKYTADRFEIYYRLDYLGERVDHFGKTETSANKDPYAFDKEYNSSRWMHQIHSEIKLNQGSLQSSLSYADYDRTTDPYRTLLIENGGRTPLAQGRQSTGRNSFFFRHMANNLLQWEGKNLKWHTQLGLEGQFDVAKGTTISEGEKRMNAWHAFGSLEMSWKDKLKIRPGVRFSYHTIYPTRPTFSVNAKYSISKRTQLRLSYGSGYRAPSFRELYFHFVDANHNIQGNPNLQPEYSKNINGSLDYELPALSAALSLSGFYNDISNRISFFTANDGKKNAPTTYRNVAQFKTVGGTVVGKMKRERLSFTLGLAYAGRYHRFSETTHVYGVPLFLFSTEVSGNLTYQFPKPKLSVSLFYKFNGPTKDYASVQNDAGNAVLEIRQLDGFNLLSCTLTKPWTKNLKMSLGAKNLLNTTFVSNTAHVGGPHGGGPRQSIAYSRSYFIRINYTLSQ